ncbi:MAG: multicopper oxidase domain-containing protein [Microcoleaceae cyanobacterium MO_207.B10]|nr:multicopper oxidase domain-containing protein [Microcoleaceae cyanobacterium MO_207.B10]
MALRDAYIIGQENFDAWSEGFDPEGYLKVLPHPDVKVPFNDPYQAWQEGEPGNYFTSWGADQVLDVTLSQEDIEEIQIDGLGILQAGDGLIPWLNNEATPYEYLRGYNGTIPGPMLIVEPGDRLEIELQNDLDQVTNLHTHGLHVSPLGHGDNVLFPLEPGETWDVEIDIPEDHFIGLDWYHPHLHGLTNEQVASGAAGLLVMNAPSDLPDLEKWDPTERPMYFMAINTFGIQQQNRPGSANDPLNQSDIELPAGTPIEVIDRENGQPVYELSDAVFGGWNAKPISYDPAQPTGNPEQFLSEYGGGGLAEPTENVIHTVNGQYNPTIDVETGEWNLFSFANMATNTFHVVQLVKEEGEEIIPQEVFLVAIDGDASGIVTDNRRIVDEFPLLNPGSRLSVQHWFEEPGTYYFLSNGTNEILEQDDVSALIGEGKGFNDGHVIWGSQVLATVEVTGDEIPQGEFPETYDTLQEQSQNIDDIVNAARDGDFDRDRTFVWDANVGGAIAAGRSPSETEVESFEGTYTINDKFFATDPDEGMPPLAMPMLGTKEVWSIVNRSGISNGDLAAIGLDIPLLEWHPFHIHQNDFTVLSINGFDVEDIEQNYLAGVLSDTIALSPSYAPGTATLENPYGTPQLNGEPSEVEILMEFEDYPGSYVNHCHILFHEDAGMMAVVRVILNTEDTWLGLGNAEGDRDGTDIELSKGSSLGERIRIKAYGEDYTDGVDVAIADVNFRDNFENNNVTDNVTDVVTIQSSGDYTVKIFDGKRLFDAQETGVLELDGEDNSLIIQEFTPFANVDVASDQEASVASGDIDGDGFAEVVVGIGGSSPVIEIYDGQNFELLASLTPFTEHEDFDSKINLAVGDATGDNFEDIYVTGGGSLEIFSGIEIDKLLREGEEVEATEVALFSDHAHPYGTDYTGEIEITGGYVLQRPEPGDSDFDDVINAVPVQTNNANITTMAVDMEQLSEGEEQVKVWTFTGGGHHGGSEENSAEHNEEGNESPLRLDAEFTPDSEMEEISGTFADIPRLKRGEPVIFGRTANGDSEIFRLDNGNVEVENKPGTVEDDRIRGGSNDDFMFGYQGNDTIHGLQGDDTVIAGPGNDLIRGNAGNDSLEGNPGFDRILGGNGNDTINGGIGRDRINGGRGNDRLIGGASIDYFIFNTNSPFAENDLGVDTIADFDLERDLILLDKTTFAAIESDAGEGFSIDSEFEVVDTNDAAATSEAFIVYSSESGNLYYNPNGTDAGFGNGAQFARLAGAPQLEADNFLLRS